MINQYTLFIIYIFSDISTQIDGLDEKEAANGDGVGSDDEDDVNKRRGPRTTIKAKQLDVLKAAFSATPKPSRHIREKLAADTGVFLILILAIMKLQV